MGFRDALLVACLLSAGGTVAAQEQDDGEARALFEAGRLAFDDGRFVDALDLFRRAHERSGLPSLWYNIGVAADRAGREAEALEAYERFIEGSPESSRIRMVQGRIAVLRSDLESESEEETQRESEEEETVTEDEHEDPESSPRPRRVASSLLMTATAGMTAAAVGVWLRANDRFDTWRDRCPPNCSNDAADSIDRRVRWTKGLTASAIALGAAAITALVWESVRVRASATRESAFLGATLAF